MEILDAISDSLDRGNPAAVQAIRFFASPTALPQGLQLIAMHQFQYCKHHQTTTILLPQWMVANILGQTH